MAEPKTMQIGVSRPPLEVTDLPEPEEVFKVKHLGPAEVIRLVIGPSLIALGLSIGSGEYLLGPLNVASYGFVGIGWVILVSALLQTFYNVELGRFTLATGEVPVVYFGRTPGGYLFWTPFAVFCLYLAFVWGGWTASAGQALFTIITGRLNTPQELEIVRILGIVLLFCVFVIVLFGERISRTMEIANWVMVVIILGSVILIGIILVPADRWVSAFASLVMPAPPPKGTDPTLLGALAGFTATASGLNYILINYYRDHGYGMGHKVGFIAALVGGKQEPMAPVGKIFPEDEKNARLWNRWFRYLVIDQWAVFFVGAIIGMMLPSLITWYLATMPGAAKATTANMPVYTALELNKVFGPGFFYWYLFIGWLILFTTQMVVFEFLVRNVTDGLYATSAGFRRLINEDPRRFYYPFMLGLAIVIAILIHVALPTELILISANMSNFGSLIFPIVLMYLNSKLPRPAKIRWWSYVVLALNVVFFGFFFLNFAWKQILGVPIVKF